MKEPAREAVQSTKILGLAPIYLGMIAFVVLVVIIGAVFIGMLHKKKPPRRKYKIPEIKIDTVESGQSKASILSKFSYTASTETFTQVF